jgi:hypothetical protein
LNTKRLPGYPIFFKPPAGRVYHPTGWKSAAGNWNLFTRIDEPTWIGSTHPDPYPITTANPAKN